MQPFITARQDRLAWTRVVLFARLVAAAVAHIAEFHRSRPYRIVARAPHLPVAAPMRMGTRGAGEAR